MNGATPAFPLENLPADPFPPLERGWSIDELLARYHTPGASVCMMRGGEIAWSSGFGVVAAGSHAPVTTRTIFQACSISKPIAAMAALRLVQAGRLGLDDDINSHLRSWQVPANGDWQPRVTLRQLLNHTAGLSYCWYPGYLRGTPLPTLQQTLRGEAPANTPAVVVTAVPGSLFRYAGGHYSVLQQLLEDVTEKPFADLLLETVLHPLGMSCSSYDQQFPESHGDVALGHDVSGGVIEGGWRVLPEMAGAGIWTTPEDLARIALDVAAAWRNGGGQLLNQPTAQAALTAGLAERGLGWSVHTWGGQLHFGHGGSNIGYRCHVMCNAETGDGIAVMTNADDGWQVVQAIIQAAVAEHGWALPLADDAPFRVPLAEQPAALDAGTRMALVGRYASDGGVVVSVEEHGGRLTAHFAGQPALQLYPVGPLTLRARALNVLLTFTAGENGTISHCTLQQNETTQQATRVG